MRKRRKQPTSEPTPEPSEELASETEAVEPEFEHVMVPEPPRIDMLWCSKCNGVARHQEGCDGVQITIVYKPV